MSGAHATVEGSQPLSPRQAALAYIAERLREDPNWNYKTDPNYVGPYPTFVSLMSDAEFDHHVAAILKRRQLEINPYAPRAIDHSEPQPRPQPVLRAALPFGQRLRDVRRALGWTQRYIASELGVSARTIIRYEQGRSAPIQAAPLLALRRLEAQARG